ncbi:hypothetical protein BAE44_0011854, partial [Dichanthelium oligosanthes]
LDEADWYHELDESYEYGEVVEYLTACKVHVLHRDLEPLNILLDENCDAKISDFGISKAFGEGDDTHVPRVRAVGMKEYRDPLFIPEELLTPWSNMYRLKGALKKMGTLFTKGKARRGIAGAIEDIKKKQLQEVADRFVARYKVDEIVAKPAPKSSIDPRLEAMHKVVKQLIGTDKSMGELISMLTPSQEGDDVSDNKIMKMVPIVGFGGLSKATLAKASYDHPCQSIHVPRISADSGLCYEWILASNKFLGPGSCRPGHAIEAVVAKTSATWAVATAAPHHATGNPTLLSGFVTKYDDDQFVHAVDGVPMPVRARGAVVTDAIVIPDVWFVPGLTANLVSVSQLAELDYSVGFGSRECCIRSAAGGTIVGKAHLREGGVYVLDFLKVSLAI